MNKKQKNTNPRVKVEKERVNSFHHSIMEYNPSDERDRVIRMCDFFKQEIISDGFAKLEKRRKFVDEIEKLRFFESINNCFLILRNYNL